MTLEARRAEFRKYVWNHAADAFQAKFDSRAALTRGEVNLIMRLLSGENFASLEKLSSAIRAAVGADPTALPLLLQLSGLTRNKIVQDIKAFARNQRLTVNLSSPRSLFGGSGAQVAAEYLARQILRVFSHAEAGISPALLEAVNQATWPGYIRQERAKRMGHEAEYRIACLLRDCGLPFEPGEKAENPLCPDVQIDGVSYDLVAPSIDDARFRVKATVHTANIGQYGESKDDLEIREAAASIRRSRKKSQTTLLALIDGVGFESNRAGLEGVLSVADEFCQFRTIWKAAAIVANKVIRPLQVALPAEQIGDFQSFADVYGIRLVPIRGDVAVYRHWVVAGDGFIQVRGK